MNILKELAIEVLEAKLAFAKETLNEEYPFLGKPHGFHIESIEPIERHPDGYLQFKVKTWDEISNDPDNTTVMSLLEVVDLISTASYFRTSDTFLKLVRME